MAARVESQAGGADDEAATSIPSAFENDHVLGATEAIMWIACRRRFSHHTIREHLKRRALNLRRHTGSEANPRLQVSPALSNRVDKATLQLFRLIIGGVPATGTLDCEGDPDHQKRIPVPVEFLKDGAYIDLLSGHLRTDPLLEKHSGYQRPTYRNVDVDRDAFFKALAAVEPRSQATDDKPIETDDELKDLRTPAGEPARNKKNLRQSTRSQDPLDDAALKVRIELVVTKARNKWPNPKKRPETKPMAIELARDGKINFRWETIRKILSGTYPPMERLGIPKL